MANGIAKIPTPINEPVRPYSPQSADRTALKSALATLSNTVTEIPNCIGSGSGTNKETVNVICPHNKNKIIGRGQKSNRADVEAAVKSALAVRQEWAALPWEERAAVFLKAADLLAGKYRYEMNAATMLGQSKTAHQAEIDAACELIDFFRFNVNYMKKIYEEQPDSMPGMWNRTHARGLEGFVLAITPFNFTSIAVNLPTAPALMGCVSIWKPANTSLLSCHVGMKILKEAGLPDGVINMVVPDHDSISECLLKHPEFAGLHFTGSTPTFNHFWRTIGENLGNYRSYPRIVGETGGKDFVFAHASADVRQLAVALVRGAFEYQGQKCSAASRAYIPKSIWPAVRDQVVGMLSEIKMGDVADFSNFVGAVIDERAFKKISGYVTHAKSASDAKIVAGGKCDDSVGFFIQPTLIETSNPNFKTMAEEIFGPVLTVYPYDDNKLEETLELCDKTSGFALTGAIFARDRRVIHQLTTRLEHAAGNFYINDKPTGAVVGQQPFGGGRNSGTNDKAGSMLNLLRWTSVRTIKENFQPITDWKYPFMSDS